MLSACEAELLTIGGLITGSNFYQDNEQHIEDNDIQFADVELFGIGSDRWHIWPVPSKPMPSYGSGGQSNNCTDFEEPTANKYINYYLEELLEDRLFSRVTALYGIDAAMEDALVSVIAGGYGDMKPPIPFKWRKASSFSFEASSRVLRSAAIRCGMPSSTHGTMTTEMLLDYWHLSLSKHAINCIEDDKSHQHQHNKGDEREAQGEDSLDLCSPVSTSTRVGGLDWKSHSVASDDTLTSVLRKVSSKHSLKKKKMPDELQELIAMDITLNTIKGEGNGEKGHLRRYECGRMMSWRQLHDSNIVTNNDVTLSSNTINCLVQEGNPLSYLMDVPLSPLWIFLRWLLAGVGVGDSRAEVLWRKLWLLGNSHRSNLKRFDALLNPSISSNYVKVLPISLLHFCLCDTTLSDHPFFEVKEKITEFRGISLTSIFPASSEGVSSKIVFSPLAASYLSTSPEWVMPPIEIINENIKVDQSFSSPYVTELLGRDKHSIPNALSVIDLFSFSGTDHYKHYLDPRCKMSIWHCAAGELRNVTREQGKETRENKKTPKGEVDLNAWVKSLPTELSDLLGGERYFSSDDESDDEEDIHPAKFLSGHNNAISALLWLRQVIVAQKLHPKQKRLIQTREFRQHILGLIEKAIDEASNEREEQLLSTRLLERHVIAMFSRANIDVSGRYEAFHDPNHKEVTNLKIITDRFTSLATQQRSCIFSKIQTFCKQGDNVVFDSSQPASSYVNFKQVWSWLADLLTTSTIELTLPWIANNAPFSFFESTLQCSLSDMVSHTQTVTNVNPLGYTSPLQCFSVTDLMSHLWLVRLQGYPDELLSPKSIPYVKTSFYVDHSDGDVSYFAGGRREKQCHRCKANLIAFVRRPILCSSCQWQYCKNCIARRTFVVNYPYNSSLCKISPHIIRKKRRNKKKSSMSRLENKKKCIVLAFDDASIASPINEYWCMDCQKMLPPERTLHLKRLISLNNIQVSTESPSKVIKALIAKNETIIEHNNLSTGTILTSVLSQPEVIEPNTDESIVKSVNPRGSTTDKMVAFSNKVEIFHPDNSKKEIKTTTSFTPQAAERVASNWNNEIPAVAKWDTDEGYKCCTLCKGKFSIFGRRRHHCRACGTLCCVQCSPNRQEVAGYSGVQRVCRGCERNDDELSNKISTLESTGRLPATSPSEGSSHHTNGFKSCLKSKSVEGVGNAHGMLDGLSSEASAALERLHRMQQSIEGSGFNIEQERQSAQAIQKDRCIAYHLVNTEYESRKQLSEASFLSPHNQALPPLPCGQFEDIQYNFPLHDTYDEVTDERVLNERMMRALMERIGELHSAVQAASTVDENGAVIEPVSTCDFFAQKGLVRHSEYKVSAIGYDDADEEFEGSIISEGPPQDTPPPLTPREDTTDKILESRNKSLVIYEPDVYIT